MLHAGIGMSPFLHFEWFIIEGSDEKVFANFALLFWQGSLWSFFLCGAPALTKLL